MYSTVFVEPGMLQSMGLQSLTWLRDWTELIFVEKKNYVARNILSVSNANDFFNEQYKILIRWLIHMLARSIQSSWFQGRKRPRKIVVTFLQGLFCSYNTSCIRRYSNCVQNFNTWSFKGPTLYIKGQNAIWVQCLVC